MPGGGTATTRVAPKGSGPGSCCPSILSLVSPSTQPLRVTVDPIQVGGREGLEVRGTANVLIDVEQDTARHCGDGVPWEASEILGE